MSLVTLKEVAQAVNLYKYGFIGTFIGWILMKLLRFTALTPTESYTVGYIELNWQKFGPAGLGHHMS